ncbi:MAG: hypothetical protein GWN30_14260 [Gammaproteobacteria bacterium]|nr:hypothetical protein [Gammaproteobacteria bacterium]
MLVITLLLAAGFVFAETQSWYKLPKQPIPPLFGDLLIDRISTKNDVKPVSFSHWRHRLQFTCRVCHFELEFQMKKEATEITEVDNRDGMFCGACHDGEKAFGHTEENCDKCHTGKLTTNISLFKKIYRRMPRSEHGNRIDWTEAVLRGRIRPVQSIYEDDFTPLPFDKTVKLEAILAMAPVSVFPHKAHTAWLDCANCHPHVFNIKKKATKNLTMDSILQGDFCGACHLNVAFPLDDCLRCHPTIDPKYMKSR